MSRVASLYQRLPLNLFVKVLGIEVARKIFFNDARYYFSQCGEDLNCIDILDKSRDGFYIDIGSNHPFHYSNTFKLYVQGWNGILVDGNKGLIEMAKKIRKKDVCIHGLVSNEKKEMEFYLAEDSLVSSLVATHANSHVGKIKMETISINEIIEKNTKPGQQIDLLSIDVEGHDFEVLQSIDLNRHRPSLIILEDLMYWQKDIDENRFVTYLKQFNYRLRGMDKQNLFFLAAEYKPVLHNH